VPERGRTYEQRRLALCLSRRVQCQRVKEGRIDVLDIIMLAIGFSFFALSIGYTIACDRL
jgi:hypothetical protein